MRITRCLWGGMQVRQWRHQQVVTLRHHGRNQARLALRQKARSLAVLAEFAMKHNQLVKEHVFVLDAAVSQEQTEWALWLNLHANDIHQSTLNGMRDSS